MSWVKQQEEKSSGSSGAEGSSLIDPPIVVPLTPQPKVTEKEDILSAEGFSGAEGFVCLPEQEPKALWPHDMQLVTFDGRPRLSGEDLKLDRRADSEIKSTEVSSSPFDLRFGTRVRSVRFFVIGTEGDGQAANPRSSHRWQKKKLKLYVNEGISIKKRKSEWKTALGKRNSGLKLIHNKSPTPLAQVGLHLGRFYQTGLYHRHRRKWIISRTGQISKIRGEERVLLIIQSIAR